MTARGSEGLYGHWTHSHEEDTEDEMVFRPATHAFPPSRGRRSLQLRRDGSYVEASPGPVDVPKETAGRWSLQEDRLVLHPEGDQPEEEWRLVAAEEGCMRLRRTENGV